MTPELKLTNALKELGELSRNTVHAGFLLGASKKGGWVIYFPSMTYEVENSTIRRNSLYEAIQDAINFIKKYRIEKKEPIILKYTLHGNEE